ncbi:DUF4232 domain-containing protein [Kitasatospora sp. NPDC101183]|uniref:DUF4232 domain-containing protein n=1 Tax=Kitasatospora sp. NPDC101183 TaxID=3364100 RepID=UPI0037FC12E5
MSARTVRTARTSRTRLLAATGLALAALSVTACGSTVVDPEAAPPAPAAPAAPAVPSAAPSAPTTKPAPKAPKATRPAPPAAPTTCTGANTRTTAAPLSRPVNHMLLTVTNTGPGLCYLYGYPAVRFGEAQAVPPVVPDSKPQAVVTLQPGQSGYASVNLSSGDGTDGIDGSDGSDGTGAAHGHTVTTLTVYFQGPSDTESVGPGTTPALPAKGAYVDDSLKVTYWQQRLDDALSS